MVHKKGFKFVGSHLFPSVFPRRWLQKMKKRREERERKRRRRKIRPFLLFLLPPFKLRLFIETLLRKELKNPTPTPLFFPSPLFSLLWCLIRNRKGPLPPPPPPTLPPLFLLFLSVAQRPFACVEEWRNSGKYNQIEHGYDAWRSVCRSSDIKVSETEQYFAVSEIWQQFSLFQKHTLHEKSLLKNSDKIPRELFFCLLYPGRVSDRSTSL